MKQMSGLDSLWDNFYAEIANKFHKYLQKKKKQLLEINVTLK